MAAKIRKGDKVIVLAGRDKGRTGEVIEVRPQLDRALVRGVNVASYREAADQDGYFVLVASPQLEAKKDEVIQKDFVFVLDVSGSMEGSKATQAKAALDKIVDSLRTGDR